MTDANIPPTTILVSDTGFHNNTETIDFATELGPEVCALDLASDTDPNHLPDLSHVEIIRIDFPNFADGRGFTIAKALRRAGYRGRLRARGHVLSDQYAMARRSGFDEVEISADLAARQPEEEWIARAGWQAHDHRKLLRAG